MGENGNTNTGDAIFMRGSDTSGSIFVDGVRDVGSPHSASLTANFSF